MKQLLILLVAIFASTPYLFSQTKAGRVDTAKHATFYTCPKHPNNISHQPGNCPECGMASSLSTKEQMKAGTLKTYTCPVHIDVARHDPGKCPRCGKALTLSPKEQMKAEVVKLYTCPMHPDVSLTKDGICPKCGMEAVEKKHLKKS